LFSSGGGFVMVTAHLGNFEVGSMLPAFEEAREVHVVREKEADPEAQAFIERLLVRAGGSHYVSHFEGEHELQGLELLNALRSGGIVGVQGDRPRSGGRIVRATMFGRPFPLPDGPATLARVAEAPLVPIFVLRRGRRHYRIEIREPIRVARSGRRDRDVAEAMQRVADEIEWAIRQAPHQWFCFREVWPQIRATTP
jgi:KDO2-lipid IV(A) lauroyltransferase